MWGRGQEDEGVIIDFEKYKLDGNTKQLLNNNRGFVDGYYNIDIGKDENHTIAFLNRCTINTSAEIIDVWVKLYDVNNVFLGNVQMKNTIQNGGQKDVAGTFSNEGFYLFCGIGLKQLESLDFSSAYNGFTGGGTTFANGQVDGVDIAKYVVQLRMFDYYPASAYYRFNVVEYCDRYEQSRLAFMNRFGAWEYMTLNKERTDELKVTRESITKPLINQSDTLGQYIPEALNGAYPLDVAKQGVMTTSVKAEESFTLFTDNLDDEQIDLIKDLMLSPQIHLLDGDNAKAIILQTSNMKLKGEKNQGLFKYELKFKYASPKHRQTLS
jgi:hypothetical protein